MKADMVMDAPYRPVQLFTRSVSLELANSISTKIGSRAESTRIRAKTSSPYLDQSCIGGRAVHGTHKARITRHHLRYRILS